MVNNQEMPSRMETQRVYNKQVRLDFTRKHVKRKCSSNIMFGQMKPRLT